MAIDLGDPIQVLTALLLLVLAVVSAVMLLLTRRLSWAERQAYRLSERAGLPFGFCCGPSRSSSSWWSSPAAP